jgi:predicted RNA-binding protein with PUA-like domain
MKEKDIENIIAQHPNEFFPESGLVLIGQQVKLGSCRADIIFKDKYNRAIIVEVKRGILSRDGAGQIMEYYGLLKQQEPDKVVELILCANIIPHERKLFLENVGIECKELGLSLIQAIAKKHSYEFLDDSERIQAIPVAQNLSTQHTETKIIPTEQCAWIFQTRPDKYDILNALYDPELVQQRWQVNQHKKEIKKGDIALIWMSGRDAGVYAVAEIVSEQSLKSDLPAEEKYWISETDKKQVKNRVDITIKANLVNAPILKDELKNIKELEDLSILKYWRGTNFPVKDGEWQIIRKIIMDRNI